MRYRAFMSYSHKDARWARWLHRRLEGYRIPARMRGSEGEFGPLPDRLAPIFAIARTWPPPANSPRRSNPHWPMPKR